MKNRSSSDIKKGSEVDAGSPGGQTDPASLHRIRFIAPLRSGRDVIDVCAAPADEPASSADLLLHLDPLSPHQAAASLARFVPRLRKGGILVLAVAAEPDDELRRAIAERFRHHACYIQRIVAGSVFLEERYAASRITPLANDPATQKLVALHLCSDAALTTLPGCLFEVTPDDTFAPRPAPPSSSLALPTPSAPETNAAEMRAGAASLIKRLLEIEEETLTLRQRPAGPQRQGVTDAGSFFDAPRTRHSWPLGEDPDRTPDTLDWYDRRPDDDVVLEARTGEAFRVALVFPLPLPISPKPLPACMRAFRA